MRVLFVYPNLNAEESFNHGIADLSGCLKADGHVTGLIHLNDVLGPVPIHEEIVKRISEWQPDFIAFSVMTQQYEYALSLARYLKSSLPNLPIAVGGVHATMCAEQVEADGCWDFIGIGECDRALPELISRLERRDPDSCNVENFWVRQPDGSYRHNPPGAYPDLDALPPKDYDIFNLPDLLSYRNGWQSVLTSRGCLCRCTYCFNQVVMDRYLEGGHSPQQYPRHYSIERIISECRELKSQHPEIETFIFDDDLFTLDSRYCRAFVKAYSHAHIGVPFVLNAHVKAFTDPVARALSQSPCKLVKFGVESGNCELRKNVLGRHMTNQQIIAAFDLCHRYGLHSSAFVMFGLPYETREMMEETINLIATIRPGRMRWAVFFPFPGTASYSICEKGGLIDQDRMRSMTQYFRTSCLKFDQDTDLFVRKLQRTFHWWVNARADFPLSPEYAGLTAEVDALDLPAWQRVSEEIHRRDREISDAHLAHLVPTNPASLARYRHYSLRYTEVMAVKSDFVTAEQGDFKSRPVRRWT